MLALGIQLSRSGRSVRRACFCMTAGFSMGVKGLGFRV